MVFHYLPLAQRTNELLTKTLETASDNDMSLFRMTADEQKRVAGAVEANVRRNPIHCFGTKFNKAKFYGIASETNIHMAIRRPHRFGASQANDTLRSREAVKALLVNPNLIFSLNETEELILNAIRRKPTAASCVKAPNVRHFEEAVSAQATAFVIVPPEFQTEDMAVKAVERGAFLFPHVHRPSERVLRALFAGRCAADVVGHVPDTLDLDAFAPGEVDDEIAAIRAARTPDPLAGLGRYRNQTQRRLDALAEREKTLVANEKRLIALPPGTDGIAAIATALATERRDLEKAQRVQAAFIKFRRERVAEEERIRSIPALLAAAERAPATARAPAPRPKKDRVVGQPTRARRHVAAAAQA